ncbi:hypothetical protein GCM10008094_31170 [Aidingimonas halophila]|nr:hypothetical protein GCM10008094_31170 [Aidingimonas halophila]
MYMNVRRLTGYNIAIMSKHQAVDPAYAVQSQQAGETRHDGTVEPVSVHQEPPCTGTDSASGSDARFQL